MILCTSREKKDVFARYDPWVARGEEFGLRPRENKLFRVTTDFRVYS